MHNLRKTFADAKAKIQQGVENVSRGVENVTSVKALRDHEILQQSASGGPGLLWKIYDARPKRSGSTSSSAVGARTGGTVSVWLLDKKALLQDDGLGGGGGGGRSVEAVLEIFRRDCHQLVKLRHPGVVRVLEPLEESGRHLALVTEHVHASLHHHITKSESDGKQNTEAPSQELQLSTVEAKHGLLQLTETLAFLHSEAQMIHLAINPGSVYLCSGGWKLAGFGFSLCTRTPYPDSQKPHFEYQDADERSEDLPTTPPLDFVPPELLTAGMVPTGAADMFALAAIACQVASGPDNPLPSTFNNRNRYHHRLQALTAACNQSNRQGTLVGISALGGGEDVSLLHPELGLLLQAEVGSRPSARRLAASVYFSEDPHLQILRNLDTLLQMETVQKAAFLRQLGGAWNGFNLRVLTDKVLPPLLLELRTPALQAVLLPLVLNIAARQTSQQFIQISLPALEPLLASAEGDLLLLILSHTPTLAKLLTATGNSNHQSNSGGGGGGGSGGGEGLKEATLAPLLSRACDANEPKIQESSMKCISTLAPEINYSVLKHKLLPRVHRVVLSTTASGVRRAGLQCFARVASLLDKQELGGLLTTLTKVVQVDRSSGTVMGAVEVGQAAASLLGEEQTATQVIPLLSPLLCSPHLTAPQLSALATTLKEMVDGIEAKRLPALREKENIKTSLKSEPNLNPGQSHGPDPFEASNSTLPTNATTIATTIATTNAAAFNTSLSFPTNSSSSVPVVSSIPSSRSRVSTPSDPFKSSDSCQVAVVSATRGLPAPSITSTSMPAADPFAASSGVGMCVPTPRNTASPGFVSNPSVTIVDSFPGLSSSSSSALPPTSSAAPSVIDQLANAFSSPAELEDLFVDPGYKAASETVSGFATPPDVPHMRSAGFSRQVNTTAGVDILSATSTGFPSNDLLGEDMVASASQLSSVQAPCTLLGGSTNVLAQPKVNATAAQADILLFDDSGSGRENNVDALNLL